MLIKTSMLLLNQKASQTKNQNLQILQEVLHRKTSKKKLIEVPTKKDELQKTLSMFYL